MKLVSMDVLYFSSYGDVSLSVNIGHTVVQTQKFTCVDSGTLSFLIKLDGLIPMS